MTLTFLSQMRCQMQNLKKEFRMFLHNTKQKGFFLQLKFQGNKPQYALQIEPMGCLWVCYANLEKLNKLNKLCLTMENNHISTVFPHYR